jgi:predicted permease
MPRRHLVSHRLVAVFLLGCVIFNYPVLAIFDRMGTLAGIPAAFVWLFAGWAMLIVLMALIVERSDRREP